MKHNKDTIKRLYEKSKHQYMPNETEMLLPCEKCEDYTDHVSFDGVYFYCTECLDADE